MNKVCSICLAPMSVEDEVLTLSLLQDMHESWAHIPTPRIKENLDSGAVVGPELQAGIFRNTHKFICFICIRSKLTRLSHQGRLPVNERIGSYFGVDVYGPMAIRSVRGNVFVFGIIEYRSKRAWLYFRKDKMVFNSYRDF